MRKTFLAVLPILAIVAVSGCIGQEFLGGTSAINPSRSTVSQGVNDIVAIENVRTLPVGTVLPDTTLRLFLSLVDKDTDPTRAVQNVVVELFDASVFRSPKDPKPLCNAGRDNCLPSICAYSLEPKCTLRAGETKAVEFTLLSPTTQQIANILTRSTLNFRANYDFTGSTNYDILVVRQDELLRLQQEGRTLSVSVQDTKGAGPLKIDVSLFTPYVVTSTQTPGDAFVVFKLRNAGTGFVKDNRITKMTIDFPRELFGTVIFAEDDKDKRFACAEAAIDSLPIVRCEYNVANVPPAERPIELFRTESDPIQFIIKRVPEVNVPHKSFTVNARVDYTYELRGSVQVTVSPPQRS